MRSKDQPLILVIDDDSEIQALLCKLFYLEGFTVKSFLSAEDALQYVEENNSKLRLMTKKLLICDIQLPKLDGLQFFEILKSKHYNIPVIFVTAHASVETAVEAMRSGAFDYITKPIHAGELKIITSRVFQFQQLEAEKNSLQRQVDEHNKHSTNLTGELIGNSQKMRQIHELINRVAKTSSNVLVMGESGTGKEIVARLIHQNSDRKLSPFVAINCSAIPDQLLESELFGHKKGAFTGASESRRGLFEEAEGGTIFLDEIGDMPLRLQAKLLRVLQERKIKPVGENQFREIDIRIIAATHKNIRSLIQEGDFREDLYYRICVIPIQIPPLRERREDILLLAQHFIEKFCFKSHLSLKTLSKAACAKLLSLPWNGNVRELENTIERALVLSDQECIHENDIQTDGAPPNDIPFQQEFSKFPTLEELENRYIQYVLEATQYSKEKTAEILGINRKTLYRKELLLR